MYLPSVLKTPDVPAPYWKMVTVPLAKSVVSAHPARLLKARTVYETHDATNSYDPN